MDTHLITRTLIVAKVREALQQARANFGPADKLVAAISGGSDSSAMLLALSALQTELSLSIVACHVNHRLRGSEADEDEEFCRTLCNHLNIECRVYKAGLTSQASEADLRATRYGFLGQCALSCASTMILTAHTQDDQVETVLLRLFRGTSMSGFTGIKPVRPLQQGLLLVRPMLNNTRGEVMQLLATVGLVARSDSSNRKTKYARNFLRNGVIPLCQQRFSSFSVQVERFRNIVAVEDDYMRQRVDWLYKRLNTPDSNCWALTIFNKEHLALQRRCIVKAIEERGVEASFERVEVILDMVSSGKPYSRLSLDNQWDVKIKGSSLVWLSKTIKPQTIVDVELTLPGQTEVAGAVIVIEPWQGAPPDVFPHRQASEIYANLAAISTPLRYRSGLLSDKIQPLGMTQTVALKHFLRTHKAPGSASDAILLLSDSEEVLWVPGYGMSDRLKAVDVPTHIIRVQDS